MITYRLATQSDIPFLTEIERDAADLFLEFGLKEMDDQEPLPLDFYETLPPSSFVAVAADGAEIVGFVVGLVVDNGGFLQEVSVKRSHARRDIGRRLTQELVGWAERSGFHCITLTTFRNLPFNAPFYKTLGFKEFTPDASWPELLGMRQKETAKGLDMRPRIAMKLDLRAP